MKSGEPVARTPALTPVDFDPFAGAGAPIVLPLTDPQQEVWSAAQMAPEASASYNQCHPMRLRGPLAIDSLRAAFQRLADRHAALRVTFSDQGDRQTVAASTTIPVTPVDLSTLSADARARAIADLLAHECREPFDLSRGPLARVHVVREAIDSHVLVFTAHHLVCDGWSSGILFQDLAALYNADRYGLAACLPDPVPYHEYVEQAVQSTEEDKAASDEYWMRQLGDAPPVLELPGDRRRPPVKTFRGANERLTLDATAYRAIKSLGARHGCTLYVTLLGGWQALLFRLTHQPDLIVGIPVSAQATLDNGNLVGHCVHMLPLRTKIEPAVSFARHLAIARGALVGAHEHQATTFGRVIRHLNVSRDSSHTTLLGVVFNVDRLGEPPSFDGMSVERLAAPRAAMNFDLGLDIADTGSELHVECNYNVDLFDASTIRRWLEYYRTLLLSAAAQPEIPVDRVQMMPDEELASLRRLGQSYAAFDAWCVHHRFEAVAARTPQAEAVRFEKDAISYDTLNRRANRIAHSLRARGVSPGSLVAVCLDRSIDLVAAILGVLKAGGAYVPLDPDWPSDRVRTMLEQARPAAVITNEASRKHCGSVSASMLCLDRDRAAIEACPDANPAVHMTPDRLAYVIFTSGSTGRPKGVCVTHENVSRLFAATDAWFHFGPADVWTLFHSFAFDFSVWELFGALLYGGRLVVVPYWVSRSPEAFHRLLEEQRVTVLNQTPSAFRLLSEVDRTKATGTLSLRLVVFGGEALDLAALRDWVDRHGDAHPSLVNMYGITETTVHVTYRPIRTEDVRSGGGRSPIGIPIPDLDLYLLAPQTAELVPNGVAGEICVGGAGVARGYLNDDALTSARFVSNPFGDRHDRLYRSGDLARRTSDGGFEYLGRIDHQVKIRGFRIELGEIETTLLDQPSVREAAVLLTTTGGGDARLVAYIVTRGGASVRADALLAHVRQRLPEYMVPSAFVAVDALPMSETGKLDRRRLPAIEARSEGAGELVAPRTATEKAIAEIWRELLDVPSIGVTDSFFDRGGHSMLAVKIVSRVRERFAIDLSIAALFHAPTIAQLAAVVDALRLTPRRRVAAADREVIEL